ncbi:glycoside hydrolase family 20 protein [Algoriphagus halophytocola]|uniref:glycoside hydrolase family 20 protein n=1 Tax=Algoriphagus halophytocola TaxID=2991499 RepID=UPI0022DD70A0|nr:glycoside hydrolase family 20 protein [Algoriphagus sp. TR-M9]WBL43003.1 glycoside hydrolase family 20 protein [Algoriphagus sp. TR-M9]
MKHLVNALLVIFILSACSQQEPIDFSIIPYPSDLKVENGQFELTSNTQLFIEDPAAFPNEVEFFQVMMKQALGDELSSGTGSNTIEIRKSAEYSNPESYSLKISSDKIVLEAGYPQGIFYGMSTLRQLLPASVETGEVSAQLVLPALRIQDSPKYDWRAMHLDVSRHFFSMDYLHRYVDLLSLYKLNKLHLHLTDDQGWRMEIKQYPELTEQGAWRTFNKHDSICMERSIEDPRFALDSKHIKMRGDTQVYGGYYTQDELKQFVAYAQSKHVEVVPEIDMPGHMMAAISVYPELTCGTPGWGRVFSTPLCPVKEEVYTFVENVLTEVMDVFPSQYIHIGADEVDLSSWEKSSACQQFMKANGMEDVEELQAYFVNRVSDFLMKNDRKVVVWDEAISGDIDSSLSIMYWRAWVASVPERVVKKGNEVILAPGDPFYFSNPKAKLFDVYNKQILSSKFPTALSHKIKGMQGSLWTETIPSEELADALIFPDALALAERAWSSDEGQDWNSFKSRLKPQLHRLRTMGVQLDYTPSAELLPFLNVDKDTEQIGVRFESELSEPTVYYTTDGSTPTLESNLYKGEFFVKGSASIAAAAFEDGQLVEPVLKKQVDYHKAIGKAVEYLKPWNTAYPAGDAGTLTDGYRGTNSNSDGYWQGFTNDVEVIVDMGEETDLRSFSATFMQNIGPGIFMPGEVEVLVSSDGEHFTSALEIANDVPADQKGLLFKDFEGSLEGQKGRYLKVIAKNARPGFIFTDEFVIN